MATLTPFFCIFLLLLNEKAEEKKNPEPIPVSPIEVPISPKYPGSQLEWFEFKPFKNLSDPSWGKLLTEIENHVSVEDGNNYRFEDKGTWAHESTHAIHAHLNNTIGNPDHYCLYTGGNKAVKIKHPKFTITEVAPLIPKSMRKTRYELYLIDQAKRSWNTVPLYLWDEWVAYCNGAEVSVELINKGTYNPPHNDSCWGVLEFSVYATYTAIAQKKLDPNYDNKQMMEFLAFNLERSMEIYKAGQKLELLNWDRDVYLNHLQTSNDAAEFRKFLIDNYGEGWTQKVFNFKK